MDEQKWVETIIEDIEKSLNPFYPNLRVKSGSKLPYASEILTYIDENKPEQQNFIRYETDILIFEQIDESRWKPRIIIEAKINKVTTHDAITYSQKAQTHKNVHPYLRYGILIGNLKDSLPGRLFRHGKHFDFMLSWQSFKAETREWRTLIEILKSEYEASLALDEIIFNSRSRDREKFTSFHRPLILKK